MLERPLTPNEHYLFDKASSVKQTPVQLPDPYALLTFWENQKGSTAMKMHLTSCMSVLYVSTSKPVSLHSLL